MRERLHGKFRFIVTGDFNINILNHTNLLIDFLNELHVLSLHPTIVLPTRVTNNTATLIDNFICDFSLLPVRTCVVTIDISDHYLVALLLLTNIIDAALKVRNFCANKKQEFSCKLVSTNWDHLYEIKDVDKAFGYFIKKLKGFIISASHISINKYKSRPPWITNGIIKSIKYKNKLFIKMKINPDLKVTYNTHRYSLSKIILSC